MNSWGPLPMSWKIEREYCMAKSYEELRFSDDFMFWKIMETKPHLCKELLELVLGHKVGDLVNVNGQSPVEITAKGRGVRFDIYAEDDENAIYDVEMQNINKGHLPKRMRYAQAIIDLNQLERGSTFDELNQSIIIYICNFEMYKDGRHYYRFKNIDHEDPTLSLEDGRDIIILATQGTADDVSEEMKSFLNYVGGGAPDSDFTKELEGAVTEAREHKKWRLEYMTFLEICEEEYKRGREDERANTKRESDRADEAEQQADKEKQRADTAEQENSALKKEISELKRLLAAKEQ